MADYVELHIQSDIPGEILTGYLSSLPFESFMEEDDGLKAYMPEYLFDREALDSVLLDLKELGEINAGIKKIQEENWNEVWESNFQPVTIAEKVWVGAPFHDPGDRLPFRIFIEPKMSFGTAHHPTTAMMIEWLLDMDLKDKNVLDMGTGTGLLAILAEQAGAKSVVAIDIDLWAFENARENIKRNNCNRIQIILGGVNRIPNQYFDLILANINRNILLEQLPVYSSVMPQGAALLLSGFYMQDVPLLTEKAARCGLKPEGVLKRRLDFLVFDQTGIDPDDR